MIIQFKYTTKYKSRSYVKKQLFFFLLVIMFKFNIHCFHNRVDFQEYRLWCIFDITWKMPIIVQLSALFRCKDNFDLTRFTLIENAFAWIDFDWTLCLIERCWLKWTDRRRFDFEEKTKFDLLQSNEISLVDCWLCAVRFVE